MHQLHPGARWIFRLRAYGFFFPFIIFLAFISTALIIGNGKFLIPYNLIFLIIMTIIIAEIYARMSYNRYLYEITPHEVKIERGIIWKKYISIPYERIQNVDIRRGIVARIFGFSTVDIETAGRSGFGSGVYGIKFGRSGHQRYESEGHLLAININDAEKIREFVIKKVKQTHKDHKENSGL